MSECEAQDCPREAVARKMCLKHYKRWRRHGDMNVLLVLRGRTPLQTIESKGWDVTPAGCWEARTWRAGRMQYAYYTIGAVDVLAHRVAYEAWVGPIPEGQIVRHECDNPPCINPAHLMLGTHADNAADRDIRGRAQVLHGEVNGSAKLSNAEVVEIRSVLPGYGGRQKDLADEYGISISHLSAIKHRRARRADERGMGVPYREADAA